MKKYNKIYIIVGLLAILLGLILIWVLFPAQYYLKAALVLLPTLLVIVGFRWLATLRLQLIRKQLLQIIETLETFDIDEPNKVIFESSQFSIFNELNAYLIELIDRILENYQANKQFTQNASHELQTPLAIIKGHVELLIQSPNLKEKEVKSLAAILHNTNRLSKLNSALILLSRIENKTFSDADRVDVEEVVNDVLENFSDLIKIRGLQIKKAMHQQVEVDMSTTLAEILVANLIQNAIRHNIEKGWINIEIKEHTLYIRNPGKILDVSVDTIFKRFYRNSDTAESLGLGLSIVKRICEVYDFAINYENKGEEHSISIRFPERKE